jgi:L-threonylcarbamoyladenylate synthase
VKTFKIDSPERPSEAIYATASILQSGGLVLYPTETFYALGALPSIAEAVERVFAIKGRDAEKALPLIASDTEAVLRVASRWPESARALARAFWPGPLSMVIDAVSPLPSVLHARSGKIAVRVSSHPAASLLSQVSGGLIVSTSANRTGRPPAKSPENIEDVLLEAADALLDAGDLPGGLPSTIVDVAVQPASLIRAGKVDWRDVQRVLGRIQKCS